MAEKVKTESKAERQYEDIIRELFFGKDSALAKFAKVRLTQYEMERWRKYGLPISEIPVKYKAYFSDRFLDGKRCDEVSEDELSKAFERLNFAVGIDTPSGNTGCYARCLRLVDELNRALKRDGLKTVEPKPFLDWLTFSCKPRTGFGGEILIEKPYGFPIMDFDSDKNRREFWTELQKIMREKRRMSMQGVVKIILAKRIESVSLKSRES